LADALNVSLSIKRLQKEIQKCVVLCANCHRIEHARLIGM
jgi:predicted HNH restriction endonuclease